MSWSNKYIGIPFQKEGYDFKGCHCWGLVWLVYLNELGIELPKHSDCTIDNLREIVKRMRDATSPISPDWTIVAHPYQDFDVVLMRSHQEHHWIDMHVGLVVGGDKLLHVEEGYNATCMPLSHPLVSYRIVKVARYVHI